MNIPLKLDEEGLAQIKAVMFETAQEAYKEAGAQQSYPEYMDKTTAMKYLGISQATLKKFINQGLKITAIDGIQRISKRNIDEFMKSREI